MLTLPIIPADATGIKRALDDFLHRLVLQQDLQVASAPTGPGTYVGQRAWRVPPASGQPMGWLWNGTTWLAMPNVP